MTTSLEWDALNTLSSSVFTPSAPIDHVELFAGRWEQLTAIKDAVLTKGQHAIVFGERGVGKTSLVRVVGPVMVAHKVAAPIVVRENCSTQDTYASLWRRALREVVLTFPTTVAGFNSVPRQTQTSLAESVSAEPSVDEVVSVLRKIGDSIVFVFDEFDQLSGQGATKLFADTIKALSDHAVSSTVILVGVAEDVATLLDAHASVERALVQVRVPRMRENELIEILVKAPQKLGMTFTDQAKAQVVRLSQGLPHYVHLIGLHAVRSSIQRRTLEVASSDVEHGVKGAISKVPQSTLDAYRAAVDSPHKDALFRHVLLACALTKTDDRGYFAPADIRTALQAIGKELGINAYASHLNKFASSSRGNVLSRSGESRRYRYRFKNPLMPTYVAMRAIADKLVTSAQVQRSLVPLDPSSVR
jgi:Cdc6-like AAA superfamily ATPase